MKKGVTSGKRLNHELPTVTAKLGWRYHHIGIPHAQPRAQEHYVPHLGVHVAGFETSPYGIEWIRFEPHCRVPEIIRIVPHIAFVVDHLDEALKGRDILIARPSRRLEFVLHSYLTMEHRLSCYSLTRPRRSAPRQGALPKNALLLATARRQ